MTKQEEIGTEELLELRNCLDDAPMPTEGRLLRIVCPHCGKVIELGGDESLEAEDD